MKKRLAFLMALLIGLTCLGSVYVAADTEEDPAALPVLGETLDGEENSETTDSAVVSYEKYLKAHEGVADATGEMVIHGGDFSGSADGANPQKVDFDGMTNAMKWDAQEGSVSWKFTVAQEGFYELSMTYQAIANTDKAIEMALSIDGAAPFKQAGQFSFHRIFKDQYNEEGRFETDKKGNELTAKYKEIAAWQTEEFVDNEAMHLDPFKFYLSAGEHTLTLTVLREPLYIAALTFGVPKTVSRYEDVAPTSAEVESTKNQFVKVQAENASAKADPSARPVADYSSPATEPNGGLLTRMNTLGGDTWEYAGQWVEYEMDIPEDGWYKLGLKFKQSYVRGLFTNRAITIDGKFPFEEMKVVQFGYSSGWQAMYVGDGDDPYYFYLTKGTHTVRLNPTLGKLTEILNSLSESRDALNTIYRKIIMITSTSPDAYQDYNLVRDVPNLVNTMESEMRALYTQAEALESVVGKAGSNAQVIYTIAKQLAEFVKTPSVIARKLQAYKENLSALSQWISTAREQALQLDYIFFASADQPLPKAEAGFFRSLWYQIVQLYGSYVMDYSGVGDKNSEGITVWISSARDQANILKRLTDEDFYQTYNIPVNVQLVQVSLINAILAGYAPDVSVNAGRSEPVNYALREAVHELDGFDTFNEVAKRFTPTALNPYTIKGHTYALPETQGFAVMFYRQDILSEMGIDIDKDVQVWDDLFVIGPILQHNNMEIGLPGMFSILYTQAGGKYYNPETSELLINSDVGFKAFTKWVNFYRDYGFSLYKDDYNRFRTGEMPITICDFGMYNKLKVAAPEIAGLWDITQIPGTRREDGTIDRNQLTSGSAIIMLRGTEHPEEAWKFMDWWTSATSQSAFGNEIEALLGAAARYATANIEGFNRLAWSATELKVLNEARKQVIDNEEVPGGYYVDRNINNAFTATYLRDQDAREMLTYWTNETNREIKRKRAEFGMD